MFFSVRESLSVTTVMPVVSADLEGDPFSALAVAGRLATGIIGAAGLVAVRRFLTANLRSPWSAGRASSFTEITRRSPGLPESRLGRWLAL